MEIEVQDEEKAFKDSQSEFHLRSLDIDISFYESKLRRLMKLTVLSRTQ